MVGLVGLEALLDDLRADKYMLKFRTGEIVKCKKCLMLMLYVLCQKVNNKRTQFV